MTTTVPAAPGHAGPMSPEMLPKTRATFGMAKAALACSSWQGQPCITHIPRYSMETTEYVTRTCQLVCWC